MKFSHSEVVLLSLLVPRPSHGYELVSRVRSMKLEKWARVRESTLYSGLRRLEAQGYITGTTRPGERGKSKRIYGITAEGKNRLDALLAAGLSSPARVYSDLIVAATFAAGREQGEALAQAEARLRTERQRLVAELENSKLSDMGRIVVEFHLGLADLHLQALRSIDKVEESPMSR